MYVGYYYIYEIMKKYECYISLAGNVCGDKGSYYYAFATFEGEKMIDSAVTSRSLLVYPKSRFVPILYKALRKCRGEFQVDVYLPKGYDFVELPNGEYQISASYSCSNITEYTFKCSDRMTIKKFDENSRRCLDVQQKAKDIREINENEELRKSIVKEMKEKDKKSKIDLRNERLVPDYVCYTDGSCDNISYHKAGGAAYIVVNTATGEIEKVKTHHCLHTTNNRMEMLAILSAVNACPKGSTIEIRTDSWYSINMFANTKWVIREGIKNPDLIQKYRDCAKGKKVILTWVKGHNGDDLNEQADCLAFGAYEQALKENGLPLAPEKYRAMRRGKQTVFETA